MARREHLSPESAQVYHFMGGRGRGALIRLQLEGEVKHRSPKPAAIQTSTIISLIIVCPSQVGGCTIFPVIASKLHSSIYLFHLSGFILP